MRALRGWPLAAALRTAGAVLVAAALAGPAAADGRRRESASPSASAGASAEPAPAQSASEFSDEFGYVVLALVVILFAWAARFSYKHAKVASGAEAQGVKTLPKEGSGDSGSKMLSRGALRSKMQGKAKLARATTRSAETSMVPPQLDAYPEDPVPTFAQV